MVVTLRTYCAKMNTVLRQFQTDRWSCVLWDWKTFGHFKGLACLHGGGGPQIGEVTCGGSPHLSCKRDQFKMRDYMDRRFTPPKRVTSPAWGPPPPCIQALSLLRVTGSVLRRNALWDCWALSLFKWRRRRLRKRHLKSLSRCFKLYRA